MANKALATRQRMRHRVEPSQLAPRHHVARPAQKSHPAATRLVPKTVGKLTALLTTFHSTSSTTGIPMFETSAASDKPDYDLLNKQLASILEGERALMTNAAQFSALIFNSISDLNWAGFYFCSEAKTADQGRPCDLLLGAFQGKVACVRIPFGRGVCGSAAQQRKTFLVPDVHAFPGHIACDSASNSEIVIPVIKDGKLYGVLDIDSPRLARFNAEDQAGLESMLAAFVAATDFSSLPSV